jgi:hypothetical protein
MKNLPLYEEWLTDQWVSFNGVACRVLKRNEEGSLLLSTPAGEVTVADGDPDLRPIDDITLPLFLQIGAPTLGI